MENIETYDIMISPELEVIELKPQKITITARTKQFVKINLIRNQGSTGYLPRIDIGQPGVYLDVALVTNENDRCKIMTINTKEGDVASEVDPKE